jgi:hypothetical protein
MIFRFAFALVVLPFLPLLLSLAEHILFGTHRVEDFFRHVGLYDVLSQLYRPIVRLFKP